jgi:hypothetical protein
MRVKGTDIYLTRGDTAFFTLDVELEEDFEIDKVFFTVKRNTKTANIIFQKYWSDGDSDGIEVSSTPGLTPNSYVFDIEIKSEDTSSTEFGLYRYDVQINYIDLGDSEFEGVLTIIKPSIFGIEEEVTLQG